MKNYLVFFKTKPYLVSLFTAGYYTKRKQNKKKKLIENRQEKNSNSYNVYLTIKKNIYTSNPKLFQPLK